LRTGAQARQAISLIRLEKRSFAPVSAFAAAMLLAALFCGTARAQDHVIGLSLPLSGNASILANQFLSGAQLALRDAGMSESVKLMTVDDGCDSQIAELAAQDLLAADVSIATGYLCNEAVPPAAGAFKDTGVPVLVAGARSSQLFKDAQKEGWNLFRIAPDDKQLAQAAFQSLSQRWRGVPWAVIDDGTVYGRTLADDFRVRMEEAGQPPVFADNFRPAQSTQAGLVRRLQKAGVSAAFVAGDADDVAILWSNVKDFDSKVEIASGESLEALQWSPMARQVPDGLLAVMQPPMEARPEARALLPRLVQAGLPPEPYVYLGYAALQVALAALADTPQATTDALKKGTFQTVTGPVQFDQTGQNVDNPYALHVWQNGRFVKVSKAAQ
jgi:branched-chain amino acid transport system substrate-binding protein